jgi:large subunit ribosomal protein L18
MNRAKVLKHKNAARIKRKTKIRGKISGTAECPRVSIFKSNKYVYAQVIDDVAANTLAAADGAVLKLRANKEDAKKLAKDLADKMKAKNIETAVFDRNGYLYHGVIASFADALRENGIKL